MAKFFFRNGGKKTPHLHSQNLGVLWLSIGLLLVAAATFFSLRRSSLSGETVPNSTADSLILAQREDSVYRQRRQQSHSQRQYLNRHKNHYSHRTAQAPAFDTGHASVYGRSHHRQPLVVELNSADTLTLQLLYGIGPTYARRIVRYRERLGGYVDLRQLLEVYGITPELLESIAPKLTLDSNAIRHLDVNHASLKELARHPYMEYYQARDIVRLRQSGITFHSVDELRTVPSMADTTLQRLAPYLSFGTATQ